MEVFLGNTTDLGHYRCWHKWDTMSDTLTNLIIFVGMILLGYRFLLAGFIKEIRQSRPYEDEPVIRSEKVDRVVKIACFVLGSLFLVTGALLLALLIGEWLK